jgi:hypothetical protein
MRMIALEGDSKKNLLNKEGVRWNLTAHFISTGHLLDKREERLNCIESRAFLG